MCEKRTITLRNADSSPRRKSGLYECIDERVSRRMFKRVKNTRYNTACSGSTEGGFGIEVIRYSTQWEHCTGFWWEIMRNGKQPLMQATPGLFEVTDFYLHLLYAMLGALREVLVGNYEEQRATANASYLRALQSCGLNIRPTTRENRVIRYSTQWEHRTGFWSIGVKMIGSTEGGNYEELRVTANVWTREKHAIQYRTQSLHVKNTRYDGARIVGTEWGFGGKLLRNGKCKRVEIHDRMVQAVVAPSGALAGN
ncbi:hypothetical protein B0H11DRAFT_1933559 [Mycena galericulata]|nr:hypothetical protein B0H11DRAFT_1933559 [Mycena galericulata]